MESSILPLLFLWAVVFYMLYLARRRTVTAAVHRKITKRKERHMLDFIDQFVGKDCIVYTVDGKTVLGKLCAVSEKGNAVLIQGSSGENQILNLDYVTRLQEHPVNKKGKKKQIVN